MTVNQFMIACMACSILLFTMGADASDVIDANEKNFDELVSKGVSLVKFYAPWCGHCKNLAPHWEAAATEMKGHVNFIKVDATVEHNLGTRYDIQGYPTIKVFQDGVVSDYEGGRSTKDLVTFAKRRISNTVEIVRTQEQYDALLGPEVLILLYTSNESSEAFKEFTNLAKKLRDAHRFGAVLSADLFKSQKEGDIVMVKPFDSETVTFPAGDAEANLENWIRNESFPLVDEIGPDNYRQYVDRGLPLAWLFIDKDAEGAQELPNQLVLAAAKEQKGKMSFVYLDGDHYRQLLSRYGFKGEKLPVFVIENAAHFWSYPEEKEVTSDAIVTFCRDYIEGRIQRTILSEAIPEVPTVKGLTTVVGYTIEGVMKSDRDVMIKFYAPWCGHCKSLAPIYEAVAEKLEKVESIVIAKMDATTNEVSDAFEVSGFPTIYFKPAGKSPMKYEGERTMEAILKFIQEHATQPFQLPGEAEETPTQEL